MIFSGYPPRVWVPVDERRRKKIRIPFFLQDPGDVADKIRRFSFDSNPQGYVPLEKATRGGGVIVKQIREHGAKQTLETMSVFELRTENSNSVETRRRLGALHVGDPSFAACTRATSCATLDMRSTHKRQGGSNGTPNSHLKPCK